MPHKSKTTTLLQKKKTKIFLNVGMDFSTKG